MCASPPHASSRHVPYWALRDCSSYRRSVVAVDATRQRSSAYEIPAGSAPVGNVFAVQGTLSYEIDFWGKYRRATEAARAQLLQTDYAKQDVMAGLVAGVATAYFTLQTLDEQLQSPVARWARDRNSST